MTEQKPIWGQLPPLRTSGEREFVFTSADFERVRKLIYDHAGIALSAAKQDMVYSRLARRLRETHTKTFGDYLALLERGDKAEWEKFVNSLTTNLTSFFREPHHFPLLAEHLVDHICRQQGIPVHGISPAAIARLKLHDWPGNVRELSNVLERALLMSDGDLIDAEALDGVMPAAVQSAVHPGPGVGLAGAVAQAERAAIIDALARCQGNKAQAARLLSISRAALYEKIAAHAVLTAVA